MAIQAEILLIDIVYFRALTPVNDTLDQNIVYQAIPLAQDKYVQPYLGDALMSKIKTDYAAGTITGSYATLLDSYIRKCVVWATMVELSYNLLYKIDNGTIVQRSGEDFTAVDPQTMKEIQDRFKNNMNYYLERMVEYLCANSSLFPEYSANSNGQRPARTNVYGNSLYVISSGNNAMSQNSRMFELKWWGIMPHDW